MSDSLSSRQLLLAGAEVAAAAALKSTLSSPLESSELGSAAGETEDAVFLVAASLWPLQQLSESPPAAVVAAAVVKLRLTLRVFAVAAKEELFLLLLLLLESSVIGACKPEKLLSLKVIQAEEQKREIIGRGSEERDRKKSEANLQVNFCWIENSREN